jgi:hypothetical protein
MNYVPTFPFPLVYLNAAQMSAGLLSAWQMLVSPPHFNPSSSPLLYVLVETGHHSPNPGTPQWTCLHQPGPSPTNQARQSGGGISLFYHSDCPVQLLPTYSHTIHPSLSPNSPPSSAVLCAIVQPHGCRPFLLAAVYLQPHTGAGNGNALPRLQALTSHIDAASAAHPSLPLLVVGDFNCHHPDWLCPSATVHPTTVTQSSTQLAHWINSFPLELCNSGGHPTRPPTNHSPTGSVIDLVLCDTPLLVSSLQQEPLTLQTDHLPFTITLDLPVTASAARAADHRPRVSWNHHENPSAWQAALSQAMTDALTPLQPLLLSLSQPIPPSTTAQALLDLVYTQVEQVLLTTCHHEVGTKVVRLSSIPWMRYPGIREAYNERRAASIDYHHHPNNHSRNRLRTARRTWAKLSAEAKLQSFSDLCEQIMSPDDKLRWKLFQRTAPSTLTSLFAIAHPSSGALPADHSSSLDNLCAAFLGNGVPPPPSDQSSYDTLVQRVNHWATTPSPSIPPHPSDTWSFTADEVKQQCTTQHTNSAPGPDALLPVFLKYAGDAVWTALASIYTFSFTHSVTPQAWREANVMALYKGEGSKSDSGSYRPISMTSILIRTFEHLIHRRLIAELDQRHYFSTTQFGFRKERSTTDAIHFLLSGLQARMKESASDGKAQQCPVLFLDISKAFDRVDPHILLQRVHDAGITGKAWLWIKAFLNGRLQRCVDASHHSNWQPVPFGVPQGCVLSPLLFLIFINQLQLDILHDPNCSLLTPLFFADDGAIGPNPLTTDTVTAADFEQRYLLQLKAALHHLDTWCVESRMRFGAKKTALVIFTTRHHPTTTLYDSLQLCGFTIALSTTYHYLGLHLDRSLSWAPHQKAAINKATAAASRVTRVALRASEVSFTAIRSLVLGYLIPIITYGILFWGRDADMSHSTRRRLQGLIARPLRVALHLPNTTHQTGVLTLSYVPTLASLVLRDQLSFLRRVCSPTILSADHPSRRLHERALEFDNRGKPYTIMASSSLLFTSIYLCSSVYPRLLNDPAMRAKLDQSTLTALTPHGLCVEWRRGVTYWTKVGPDRRIHAKQSGYSLQHLRDAVEWSLRSAQHLSPLLIRTIRDSHAHAEWEAEHLSPPSLIISSTAPPPPTQRAIIAAALPAPAPPPHQPQHPTTAPLTRCKPAPGLPPFLTRWSRSSHRQRILRARFLMGRACTGTVRLRFAKVADRPSIDDSCTCPSCQPPALPAPAPAPYLDTIEHAILYCQRHAADRLILCQHLHRLGLPPPLTLSTLLVAHTPPPPFPSSQLSSLLHYTASFLATVEAERLTAGLVPLDTG